MERKINDVMLGCLIGAVMVVLGLGLALPDPNFVGHGERTVKDEIDAMLIDRNDDAEFMSTYAPATEAVERGRGLHDRDDYPDWKSPAATPIEPPDELERYIDAIMEVAPVLRDHGVITQAQLDDGMRALRKADAVQGKAQRAYLARGLRPEVERFEAVMAEYERALGIR